VLDLDPIVGVAVASDLSARELAAVVLVLARWPHPEAVLPTADLIDALVRGAKTLRADHAAPNVAFVLDGQRSGSVRRRVGDPRVDNRYDMAVGDLPNLHQLRAAGIQRVVKITHVAQAS
jgi:hypothetical protein